MMTYDSDDDDDDDVVADAIFTHTASVDNKQVVMHIMDTAWHVSRHLLIISLRVIFLSDHLACKSSSPYNYVLVFLSSHPGM